MNDCSFVHSKIQKLKEKGNQENEKDLQNRCGLCELRKQNGGSSEKTAGVKDATVNFMALKMIVEFEDGQEPKAVMKEVLKNCKKVEDDCEIFL